MSISKRLKGPTPVFFKKLRTWIIWLSSGLTSFGGILLGIPPMVSGLLGHPIELPIIVKIGVQCIIIGPICLGLGAFLTSLPLEINQETKEEAKAEVKEEISKTIDESK